MYAVTKITFLKYQKFLFFMFQLLIQVIFSHDGIVDIGMSANMGLLNKKDDNMDKLTYHIQNNHKIQDMLVV